MVLEDKSFHHDNTTATSEFYVLKGHFKWDLEKVNCAVCFIEHVHTTSYLV